MHYVDSIKGSKQPGSSVSVVSSFGGALKRVSSYAAMTAVAATVGGGAAWAQCTSTNNSADIINFAPFAKASTVNSIVSTMNTVHLGSLAQSSALVGSPSNPGQDQPGAGRWTRVIGGSVETEGTSTANVATVILNGPNAGTVNAGTVTCNTAVQQDFWTHQFGFDLARHNFAGGASMHFGFTGGYTEVSSKDKTAAGPVIPGGSFEADSQIPFAGLYGAFYSGPLTIDAQLRGDFIRSQLTDPITAMQGQDHSATSTAFLLNAAYRFDLPNRWFIEPSIGGVWSIAIVDDIQVPGQFAAGDLTGSSPGLLRTDDVYSALGRASVRVGTTIVADRFAWQPFLVASVFHEFAGNVTSQFFGNDALALPPPNIQQFASAGEITTTRIGTYGHVGVGIAGVLLNTGWLGYARVDYRAGDNIESLTANAGLRYQFEGDRGVAGSVKDGGGPERPIYNWTGFHASLVSGAVWGESEWQLAFNDAPIAGATTDPAITGYAIGGQIGYDKQIGSTVIGIAADYSFADVEAGQGCPGNAGFFLTCKTSVDNLAFITGRLGFAMDRTLIYVRGGLAIADVEQSISFNLNHVPAPIIVPNGTLLKSTETQIGWTAGGGIEFAFSDRWSASAEYMFFDLGTEKFDVQATAGGGIFSTDAETEGSIIRTGLTYRFGHRAESYEALK
jgi:opacity protein-like surface antigen